MGSWQKWKLLLHLGFDIRHIAPHKTFNLGLHALLLDQNLCDKMRSNDNVQTLLLVRLKTLQAFLLSKRVRRNSHRRTVE